MRDFSPEPILIRNTVRSSMARTARKPSDSAPGTFATSQVAPPSMVRRYVPLLPLAQTTRSFTALTPRNDAVVLLVCGVQDCATALAAARSKIKRELGNKPP